MADFRTIAKVTDVNQGELKRVVLDGGSAVCLANVDGVFYAIAAKCSHDGGSLAEGTIDGTTITCPLHGAMFDATSGEVLGPPAGDSVATYEVRVQGDDVQVARKPLARV